MSFVKRSPVLQKSLSRDIARAFLAWILLPSIKANPSKGGDAKLPV